MPTLSELRADIRKLAKIDTRHRFLADVKDAWFDRTGLIILTERARDGTPLVGVMLKYPAPCPADKTATLRIKFWVADLDRPDDLDAAFKRNIAAINTKMAELGVQRVWGLVPKNADHLTVRLEPIATAAKCVKTDGATVEGKEDFGRGIFYFGDRTAVDDFVQGR